MGVPVTERFTDRVADYVKARPGYPEELVARLRELGALRDGWTVADVGSGTGISAELLLRHGLEVVAVEPNAAMRRAAEDALGARPGFRSVAGTSEATTLPDASVDAIFAAQAFHWFEPAATRREFLRIVRGTEERGGPVTLVWNDRRLHGTPFLEEYEALLQRFGTDYNQVTHRRIDDGAVAAFFAPSTDISAFTIGNVQALDRDGLRGRLRSSSYVPGPGSAAHEPMLRELDAIFGRHARGGVVEVGYDVRVWVGRLRG